MDDDLEWFQIKKTISSKNKENRRKKLVSCVNIASKLDSQPLKPLNRIGASKKNKNSAVSSVVGNNEQNTGSLVTASKYFPTIVHCKKKPSAEHILIVEKKQILNVKSGVTEENVFNKLETDKCFVGIPTISEIKTGANLDPVTSECLVKYPRVQEVAISECCDARDNAVDCSKMKSNNVQCWDCPVCFQNIEETVRSEHVRICFTSRFERPSTSAARSCELCYKDISCMNPQRQTQHINRCLDRQIPKSHQPDAKLLCPLCGSLSKTDDQKFTHIKRCSRKLGIEPQRVIEASRLLEKQLNERKALGLPMLQPRVSKQSPKKRNFAAVPRSNNAAQMQMALALSASLKPEDDCAMGLTLQIDNKDKGRRKKTNRLPDYLQPLYLQTEEERQRIVELKVSALLFPHVEDVADSVCENANTVQTHNDHPLWTKTCTLESDVFYVPDLNHFISSGSTCIVKSNDDVQDREALKLEDRGINVLDEEDMAVIFRFTQSQPLPEEQSVFLPDIADKLSEDEMAHSPSSPELFPSESDDEVLSEIDDSSLDGCSPKSISPKEGEGIIDLSDSPEAKYEEQSGSTSKTRGTIESPLKISPVKSRTNLHHTLNKEHQELPPFDLNLSQRSPALEVMDSKCSPYKDKKRYLEDVTWQTPKRSNSGHQCPIPLKETEENESAMDDMDLWAAFEDDCCIEMVEMPEAQQHNEQENMQIISSPTKPGGIREQCTFKKHLMENQSCTQLDTKSLHFQREATPKAKYSLTQQPSTKLYDEATPLPNYRKMVTPELRNALKKYGVRRLPRSKAVVLLNHIYELTHPLVDEEIHSGPSELVTSERIKNFDTKSRSPSKLPETIKSPVKNSPKNSETDMQHSLNKEDQEVSPFDLNLSQRSPALEVMDLKCSPDKDKKICFEDITWQTPRSNPECQCSMPLKESGENEFAVDVWDAFEDDCCIEMVETPKSQLHNEQVNMEMSSSLTKIKPETQPDDEYTKLQACSSPNKPGIRDQWIFKKHLIENKSLTQVDTKSLHFQREATQQLSTKLYDEATPLPDYRKMVTPELRNALKKYGVRRLPRSKAVVLLNHIYELTHPLVDEDKDGGSSERMKDTKFPRKQMQKSKTTIPKAKTRKTLLKDKTEGKAPDELSSSQNSGISSSGEMPEESRIGEPVVSADADLKTAIKTFIRGDRDLYDKILLYEPISVHELHQNLKQNKIAATMPQLMDFLDEECITFSLPRSEKSKKKQQARTQRFRKRVLSKIAKENASLG